MTTPRPGTELSRPGSAPADATAQTLLDDVDGESARWLAALRGSGQEHEDAVRALHGLLLRGARFELGRRHSLLGSIGRAELDDLAVQAADDACVAVLARLDDFRGLSRFTTWAYKFAIYEASVKARRRSWQGREIPLPPEDWVLLPDAATGPAAGAEYQEMLAAVRDAVDAVLTPHQRSVLVTLVVSGVPVDVLADRLGTTRGALYKTLHDARRKLRARLEAQGLVPGGTGKES